jgi:hypothetical protein
MALLALVLLLVKSGFAGIPTLAVKGMSLFPGDSVWLIETVDTTGSCFNMHISLALSSEGSPHISYYDSNLTALRYAYRSASGWIQSTVDNSSAVGRDSSLDLDAAGFPHIAYRDMTNNDLKLAEWNGSTWMLSTIGVDDFGWFPTLKVDTNGYAHIAYLGYSPVAGTQTPKYAQFTGTDWEFSVIDQVFGSGGISLGLDSMDHPHVSYHAANELRSAVLSGTHWLTATVDSKMLSGDYVGMYNSIALDSHDRPHISYALYGQNLSPPFPNDLKYAWQTQTGWHFALPDTAGEVGFFSSLDLDSQDYPRISYYASDTQSLKYARWDGADWIIEIVDAPVNIEGYTSLAVDQMDVTHLAYCDGASSEIKYAHRVILDHLVYFPITYVQFDSPIH